jgi:PPOX class probable F420-dependent enzyme
MTHKTEHARLEAFLKPSLIAVAATVGTGGMPQLTPVWYVYREGAMLISVTKERLKYKNLVRDSRLSVCVYGPPLAKVFVTMTGRVELADDDSIWEPTRAICERYMSQDEIEPWMQMLKGENRVIITLRPDRVMFKDLDAILPAGPNG